MDSKAISILLALVICSISSRCSSTKMGISKEEDMEFERQLKILNKQPVKTIQTVEGDIIDCINIYKQPAFDHPLLKNHKLQLRPSSFPIGLPKPSSKFKSIKLKSIESCPTGTVAIKRTEKEDLIRVKLLSERRRAPINVDEVVHFPGSHIVNVIMKDLGFPYYGATAKVAVYNLSIAPDQASSTNMWIQSGPPEEVNVITTGWKVSHQLNGDNLTRLFTYWTGDGYQKTGCYNTLCPGFVQTDKGITGPNVYIHPTSTRGGPNYAIKLLIFQDRQTGNWWLSAFEHMIGYFPKELFSHLGDGAKHVAWGGISNAGKNGISPPMGNGYFPNDEYYDTCYFKHLAFINDKNKVEIPKDDATNNYVDKSGCFALQNNKNWGSKLMGYAFMFGGPGGNCGV